MRCWQGEAKLYMRTMAAVLVNPHFSFHPPPAAVLCRHLCHRTRHPGLSPPGKRGCSSTLGDTLAPARLLITQPHMHCTTVIHTGAAADVTATRAAQHRPAMRHAAGRSTRAFEMRQCACMQRSCVRKTSSAGPRSVRCRLHISPGPPGRAYSRSTHSAATTQAQSHQVGPVVQKGIPTGLFRMSGATARVCQSLPGKRSGWRTPSQPCTRLGQYGTA